MQELKSHFFPISTIQLTLPLLSIDYSLVYASIVHAQWSSLLIGFITSWDYFSLIIDEIISQQCRHSSSLPIWKAHGFFHQQPTSSPFFSQPQLGDIVGVHLSHGCNHPHALEISRFQLKLSTWICRTHPMAGVKVHRVFRN